jgi:pilus assembly protein CpaB
MRRGRIFFYLAFILLLGLVAAAVIWLRFVQPNMIQATAAENPVPTPVIDLVNVVVAAQRIPRGGVIDENLLGMVQIQRELVIQGYFTDPAQLVGRRARLDLEANMLLTSSMVVDGPEQLSSIGSVAALQIPRGMVAISVPINRLSSVSYAPQAGDHVNVIATMLMVDLDQQFQTIAPNQSAAVLGAGPGVVIGTGTAEEGSSTNINPELSKMTAQNATGGIASVIGRAEVDPILDQLFYAVPSERQRPRLVSQTLLQDAVVLGLGNFPLADEAAEPVAAQPVEAAETGTVEGAPVEGEPVEEALQAEPEPKLPDVITLIVSPQDAVTLNYMIFGGAQLTLALRPAGDDTRVETEATTLDFLLQQYNIPVPAGLPYGLEPRVDDLILPELPNDVQPTPEE